MIDVDEIEAGSFLAEANLTGPRLHDLDGFPLEDLRPSGLMDSDRVRHGSEMDAHEGKEKPRSGGPRRGFASAAMQDQPAACAASAASSSKATMLVILIIGLTAGPAVSL